MNRKKLEVHEEGAKKRTSHIFPVARVWQAHTSPKPPLPAIRSRLRIRSRSRSTIISSSTIRSRSTIRLRSTQDLDQLQAYVIVRLQPQLHPHGSLIGIYIESLILACQSD